MVLQKILHMNSGNGETSYANNSSFQNVTISKTWDLVDETLRNMLENGDFADDHCLNLVDLGCASGPNALSVVSHVTDTIQELRKNGDGTSQEIQFFLNDLPNNDFNSLFKLVEIFNKGKEVCGSRSRCSIYGLPGSFYSRLFPRKTLHFAYSSCSLHWLSQVPYGLESENEENIYIAVDSPSEVLDAYAEQYKRDLFTFLSLRGEEMVPGGHMVLTFIGRRVEDRSSKDDCAHLAILAQTLLDMVTQGLLKKDDLHSFNVPIYMPCQQEIESIISQQGSFKIKKIVTFPVRWDVNKDTDESPFDKTRSGNLISDCVRAFMEPMLVSHFGELIDCNVLFERYSVKIGEYFSKERTSHHMLAISMTIQ
ncbi:benzoate carboxyl methyltransferase-like [Henckelia pumila]|uniref:benzoate carboxyl methyltransferase-like n=1 Tax=Henckelia pumila TaxID=405737 RepID=UPI003C6E607D